MRLALALLAINTRHTFGIFNGTPSAAGAAARIYEPSAATTDVSSGTTISSPPPPPLAAVCANNSDCSLDGKCVHPGQPVASGRSCFSGWMMRVGDALGCGRFHILPMERQRDGSPPNILGPSRPTSWGGAAVYWEKDKQFHDSANKSRVWPCSVSGTCGCQYCKTTAPMDRYVFTLSRPLRSKPPSTAPPTGIKTDDEISSALVAENQQLRSEVRLLRQQLATAGAGAGSHGVLAASRQQAESPDVAPTPAPHRRTLQELLPPRSSPFRKYLFLNESIFDGVPRHARTTFNPPANLGAVIKPDQPWEAGIYPFAQVIQFGNEIRVYYHCQGDTPLGTFLVPMLCLAISTDGRSFIKPDLGAVPFNGTKHNNIVLPTTGDVGAQATWYVVDAFCCVYTCRRLIDLSLIAGTHPGQSGSTLALMYRLMSCGNQQVATATLWSARMVSTSEQPAGK